MEDCDNWDCTAYSYWSFDHGSIPWWVGFCFDYIPGGGAHYDYDPYYDYMGESDGGNIDNRQQNTIDCDNTVIFRMFERWVQSNYGMGNETCFALQGTANNYTVSNVILGESTYCEIPNTGTEFVIVHVHPTIYNSPQPSQTDKNLADNNNIIIYTITNQGSYRYTPNGTTTQITSGLDWLTPCSY